MKYFPSVRSDFHRSCPTDRRGLGFTVVKNCSNVLTVYSLTLYAKRRLMVFFEIFRRDISVIEYHKSYQWFFANTLENKCCGILLKRLTNAWHCLLWHHILCHLSHLLALCLKSHKPPFCLGQLILYLFSLLEIELRETMYPVRHLYNEIELHHKAEIKWQSLKYLYLLQCFIRRCIWYLAVTKRALPWSCIPLSSYTSRCHLSSETDVSDRKFLSNTFVVTLFYCQLSILALKTKELHVYTYNWHISTCRLWTLKTPVFKVWIMLMSWHHNIVLKLKTLSVNPSWLLQPTGQLNH